MMQARRRTALRARRQVEKPSASVSIDDARAIARGHIEDAYWAARGGESGLRTRVLRTRR
jgi:hypothetical protein